MTLFNEILEELAELDVDDRTFDLVLASLEAEKAVERVLTGGSVKHPTTRRAAAAQMPAPGDHPGRCEEAQETDGRTAMMPGLELR